MRMSRLTIMFAFIAGSALVACGDDGGKGGTADAAKAIDAPGTTPDAPAAGSPTALGKKCTTPADCPANATECVGLAQGANSYCTPKCATNAMGMTNASGGLPLSAVMPAPNNATCTTAFTGVPPGGTIGCGLILKTVPADNPLMANKAYTGIDLGCIVLCMAGACPTGMTCSPATQNMVCLPN
jgi:hypothetical protein